MREQSSGSTRSCPPSSTANWPRMGIRRTHQPSPPPTPWSAGHGTQPRARTLPRYYPAPGSSHSGLEPGAKSSLPLCASIDTPSTHRYTRPLTLDPVPLVTFLIRPRPGAPEATVETEPAFTVQTRGEVVRILAVVGHHEEASGDISRSTP